VTTLPTTFSPEAGSLLVPRLRAIPLFRGLSACDLEHLAHSARRATYRAGTRVIVQGEPEADRLFVILTGSVHIQRDTAGGRTVTLGLRGPGEHFGEMALLDDGPRMADAVTAGPCELLVLSRSAFRECVRTSPEMGLALTACLSRRLREAADLLESRHELDVTGRLAERVLEMARVEGERQPDGTVRLPTRWTHQQLAEMIGTTRESVTRALDDLRAIKALRTESRPTAIVILDERRLQHRCAR
jgi:CRP-like cAMP-binding protein